MLCNALHCDTALCYIPRFYVLHCSVILLYAMLCTALDCATANPALAFPRYCPNLKSVLNFLSNLWIMQSFCGLRDSKRHFVFWTYRSVVCGQTQSEIAMASCAAANTGDARCDVHLLPSTLPPLFSTLPL